MEFVMLFCSDRFQYGNPLLFFFFNLFSILPTRFKDPFILKKSQRSKNNEHLLSNAFCGSTNWAKKIYIYTNPGRLKNKSRREKKAEKLVDRSLSLTMEQSVRPWRKRKSWKSFLSGKHIYHGRITVKAREFSRFSRFSILLWQGRFTTRGSSNIFDGG